MTVKLAKLLIRDYVSFKKASVVRRVQMLSAASLILDTFQRSTPK